MNDYEAGTSHVVMDDFDVFLNHRGPDVKATFVAHLDDALTCAGFRPFLDARSLMKGNPAFKSIDETLDMAKVHVAVVSKRYAESKYCLNELVAMMRSGKPVIPVFYDVEPVDLRWLENGPFAEAFEKHKSKGRTEKRVQEWRAALRELSEITGFRLADYKSDEAKLKREVVNEVARLTPSNQPVEVEHYRVGLVGPAQSCIQMLENMGAGTGMLGLVGMGGVGKTTLAREIYNHFVAQKKFRYMTFLEIHRDPSSSNVQVRPTWSRKLRKQLLWDLLRVHDGTSSFSSWFQKVSTLGPVFIVIDDVHKLGQFEELVPFTSVLHPGSRIIVTSRDRSILSNLAERTKLDHYLFDVSTLDLDESNMLFNWHAFQAKEAPEDYESLAKEVVQACGGLPLALKVIGSSLFDKRSIDDKETIWHEAIDALMQCTDIIGILKWSYDTLSKLEKRMFVDITCLFYFRQRKEALEYWASCKNCTSCGGVEALNTSLRNLSDKNLIIQNPDNEFFKVHDLLKDMGQGIGRKAKSHIVDGSIADGIVTKNHGTNKTLGLNLAGSRKRKFEVESFANMPNLHFLLLPDECSVNGNFTCMSRELRWLQWRGMPFARIPIELNLCHLISLDFSKSTNLASLWTESDGSLEACPNLLRLNLTNCTSITKLPDSIGKSSQLQYLDLEGCKMLKKLPESIGQFKALKYLKLGRCTSLKALPDTVGALSNLQILYAYKCNSLLRLPTCIGLLSSLRTLHIQPSTECQSFLDGIGEAWTRLKRLVLYNCGGLGSRLNYGALKSLEWLTLQCSVLTQLPESIGLLTRLKMLKFSCERLQCLPKSIGNLKMLEILWLSRSDNLTRLPKTLGALANLVSLSIECHLIRRIPKSIGQLSQLRWLKMRRCKNLEKLPTSIRQLKSLQELELIDCGSIEAIGALTTLQGLPIWGTTSITILPPSLRIISSLVVYDYNYEHYFDWKLFVGTRQVLEEDESGFLKAYHDESSGLTRLLRGSDKQLSSPMI